MIKYIKLYRIFHNGKNIATGFAKECQVREWRSNGYQVIRAIS